MRLLLCAFVTLTVVGLSAQNAGYLDSLSEILSSDVPDTVRIKALNELAYQLRRNDPQKGLEYAREGLELSQAAGYRVGERDAYNSIASIEFHLGDYYSSMELFNNTLAISQEMGDQSAIARSYNALGVLHRKLGNYDVALENNLASLRIREELQDSLGIAVALGNIASLNTNMGRYDEAVQYSERAMEVQLAIGDAFGLAGSHISLGNVFFFQYELDSALRKYQTALEIGKEIGDIRTQSLATGNIAGIYASRNNFDEALKWYTRALEIDRSFDHRAGESQSHTWLAGIHLRLGNYGKAEEHLEDGMAIALEQGNVEQQNYLYEVWTSLDSLKGDFESAWRNYRLFISTRDSLVNIRTSERVVQQQMEYEFEKRQALAEAEQEAADALAAKELQRQRLVKNFFIGGFLISALFALVLFRQRARIREGKRKSDELLLNILPTEVADELKLKGKAQARMHDTVTVMFTDFKDFTEIAAQLTAEELVFEIDTCFKAFDEIVSAYGIEKIKTIGDSYMCAGGLPVQTRTHAIDVVRAALDMQDFISSYIENHRGQVTEGLVARIGIHTGSVVAGIVGVKKFQYDIWGDTVNIASRMETSGEVTRVNISRTTYELVKEDSDLLFESRGELPVEGKGLMEMYFVSRKAT